MFESLEAQIRHAVVRVESITDDAPSLHATGLCFHFATGTGGEIPAILVPRRWLEGAGRVRFHMLEGKVVAGVVEGTGAVLTIEVPEIEVRLMDHPDPDVDLCALPLAPLRQLAARVGKALFYSPLEEAFLAHERVLRGLHATERVLVPGFDAEAGVLPHLREGLTGSPPVEDFRGRSLGLIDMACVPGTLGAPVLICDQGSYTEGTRQVSGDRIILLGLLTDQDPVALGEPTMKSRGGELGLYQKASCILDLGRHLRARVRRGRDP